MSHRILIVDDDEDIQLILKSVLSSIPTLLIESAFDGDSALSALRTRAFDGMILDYMLPDMSGSEILESLSDLPPGHHPVAVILSARNDAKLLAEWQALGVKAVLSKPFNPLQIIEDLRTAFEF